MQMKQAGTSKRLDTKFLPLPCIGTYGGRGLFQAIELVTDKERKTSIFNIAEWRWMQKFYGKDIWTRIRGLGFNRMEICPPCTITMEEADRALDIVKSILVESRPQSEQ